MRWRVHVCATMNRVGPRVNTQKQIFSCSAPRPQRRGLTFHGPRPQVVVGVCHACGWNRSCTWRRFALPRPEPTHPQDASAPPRYSASASAPQIGGVALAGCPAGDHEVTAAGAPPVPADAGFGMAPDDRTKRLCAWCALPRCGTSNACCSVCEPLDEVGEREPPLGDIKHHLLNVLLNRTVL